MRSVPLKVNNQVVLAKCWLATSFFPRFLGLMGRKNLAEDQAVLFPNCNSIHTMFMRFPIDVVMVDESGEVVEIIESMKAWRMLLPRKHVKHTLEFRGQRARELGIGTGTVLQWE